MIKITVKIFTDIFKLLKKFISFFIKSHKNKNSYFYLMTNIGEELRGDNSENKKKESKSYNVKALQAVPDCHICLTIDRFFMIFTTLFSSLRHKQCNIHRL